MSRTNALNTCFLKLAVNFYEPEVIFKSLFKGIIVGVSAKKKHWLLFFYCIFESQTYQYLDLECKQVS